MAGFLIGEALRDLRRAGRVAVSAIVLITLSLAALGGFWLVSSNLDRAVARWRDRVRIVVYLKREPSPGDVASLLERVRTTPGVAAVAFVGKAEALRGLKQVLGKDASVVDQLPANPLPASPSWRRARSSSRTHSWRRDSSRSSTSRSDSRSSRSSRRSASWRCLPPERCSAGSAAGWRALVANREPRDARGGPRPARGRPGGRPDAP